MATLDDYCEARSSDESDAGSLEDFIVGSESDDGSEETVPSSDNDQEVDAANIIATRQAGTLRRSTRTSKAPVRYVDDDYIRLMTEDADAEVAVVVNAFMEARMRRLLGLAAEHFPWWGGARLVLAPDPGVVRWRQEDEIRLHLPHVQRDLDEALALDSRPATATCAAL